MHRWSACLPALLFVSPLTAMLAALCFVVTRRLYSYLSSSSHRPSLSLLMRFTSMCPCIALFPACIFFILIRLFCLSVCLLACLLVVDIRAIHSQELTRRRTIIEIGQRRSSISYHPEHVSIIKQTRRLDCIPRLQ